NFIDLTQYNKTLEDFKHQWPLNTTQSNSFQYGIRLSGFFNATNFVYYPDEYGNQDLISLSVSSFESFSISTSVIGPDYHLMPCEELWLSLGLEHDTLLNRDETPCRDEYPNDMEEFTKQPLTVGRLYNPVFGSNDFPYDPEVCKSIC